MIERIVDKLPGHGGIVSQGDHATIDARSYHLQVTVEDRARLLAEVGQALRPVLEQMQSRIAALEQENVLLRDTMASLAPVTRAELPPPLCLSGGAREGHHARAEPAPVDVGSQVYVEGHADPWERPAPATSAEPGAVFFEAIRGAR